MNTREQSAPARAPAKNDTQHNPTTRRPTRKADRILRHFATGARLHRFQAERLGDHCLPSTVARLQQVHPIVFQRQIEQVPTQFGTAARVAVYWLEGDSLKRAKEITQGSSQGG